MALPDGSEGFCEANDSDREASTRIRRIKHRHMSTRPPVKDIATSANRHYHIGASQNNYVHIPSFILEYKGDPAVEVGDFASLPTCNLADDFPRTFYPS
jgi:hypothetical protein